MLAVSPHHESKGIDTHTARNEDLTSSHHVTKAAPCKHGTCLAKL